MTRGSGVFRTGEHVSWCGRPCILKSMLPLRVSSNSTERVSPVLFALFALMVDGCSRFEIGKILTSMNKFGMSTALCGNLGDLFTLLYNSARDFMYTTFSMHIAGKVLQRTTALDRV